MKSAMLKKWKRDALERVWDYNPFDGADSKIIRSQANQILKLIDELKEKEDKSGTYTDEETP